MTIHAVVTVSSNRADTVTGYVGNLTAELRDRLAASPLFRRLAHVDVVPFDLLRPRGALDLVSAASARGLVWHVAPRSGYPAEWIDLRVYDADGTPLVRVAWEDGKATTGYGYMSVAAARRALEAVPVKGEK